MDLDDIGALAAPVLASSERWMTTSSNSPPHANRTGRSHCGFSTRCPVLDSPTWASTSRAHTCYGVTGTRRPLIHSYGVISVSPGE